MREIKFRAYVYCPITEKYHMRQHESIENNCGAFFFQPEKYTPNPHIIMQFTGLHDKNGREIYEGDELFVCAGYRSTVAFQDGMFVSVYKHPEDGEIIPLLDAIGKDTVVIGNIHENPELIQR